MLEILKFYGTMIKLASMRGISWYVVVFSPKASLDYLVGVKADWKEMCQYLIKSEGARPNLLVNTAAFCIECK